MSMFQPIRINTGGQDEIPGRWEELERSAESALAGNLESWYSVNQFAEKAGVPANTVYQWINRDKVQHDTSPDGLIVINPLSLIDVPRPVVEPEIDREVWTGTLSRPGRDLLRANSLGGNESYTVELGARLLLALFGRIDKEEALGYLEEFCSRHPHLRTVLQHNVRSLAEELKD